MANPSEIPVLCLDFTLLVKCSVHLHGLPMFPFYPREFRTCSKFSSGKKAQSGSCLNGFVRQAVSLVRWHQQLILLVFSKNRSDRDQVFHYIEQQVDVYVPCKRTGPESLV